MKLEEIADLWRDDQDGEYISVLPDENIAFYIAHGVRMKSIWPLNNHWIGIPQKENTPTNDLWAGIRNWQKRNNFYPNIWHINERGNVTLYDRKGKDLGGIV